MVIIRMTLFKKIAKIIYGEFAYIREFILVIMFVILGKKMAKNELGK